jgi:hypothetical protein
MPSRNSKSNPGDREPGPPPVVEITTKGRCGWIYYREGANSARFDWEFAAGPALALIFGTAARAWDGAYPWAAGRQAEIYDFVGAETVRQKAVSARFEVDLDAGDITVLDDAIGRRGKPGPAQVRPTSALKRFVSSIVPVWKQWAAGQRYDVAALKEITAPQRDQAVALITDRDITWREVEALAAIDTPQARAAVDAAAQHHLSIDTRLAAAAVMHQQGRLAEVDTFVARQLHLLDRPANGLARALAMAERYPSEVVKQALLWASYNSTECAPECARLLLRLTGAAREPFDENVHKMLLKLDLHNSYFDRKTAFDELCALVAMKLDTSASYY